MKPNKHWPIPVFQSAHAEYPKRVAFFGHGRPVNLEHSETCESVWRGLLREKLQEYAAGGDA